MGVGGGISVAEANCYLESIELKGKIVALFGVLGREA
jgi:hypothetical protein